MMKEYIPTNVSIGLFYDTSQSRLVSLLMTPPIANQCTRTIYIETQANLDAGRCEVTNTIGAFLPLGKKRSKAPSGLQRS